MVRQKDKVRMPAGVAGLTMYFEDSPEVVRLKPEYIVGIVIALLIVEAYLYFFF